MNIGKRDKATVTETGERLEKLIEGVQLRRSNPQIDERGELFELYDPRWGVTQDPLVYVYATSVREQHVKGWVYHRIQTDRLFIQLGFAKIILYDLREESKTFRMKNEIYVSERNRALLVIPPMIAHAVQNIGKGDVLFVNMPSHAYDHSHPDKYRIERSEIPHEFLGVLGW